MKESRLTYGLRAFLYHRGSGLRTESTISTDSMVGNPPIASHSLEGFHLKSLKIDIDLGFLTEMY